MAIVGGDTGFAWSKKIVEENKRKEVKKMAELKNVEIQFVSLVDKAANKKKFAIIKNEDGIFENYCPIIKADDEKQEVTAIVYEPMVKDAHGEFMNAEEIEKAQRSHALNGFGADVQHSFMKDNSLKIVESWIQKEDGKIGEQDVVKGTWLQTVFVDSPDLWSKIKKGEFTGFSMGGKGERVEKQAEISTEEKGFIQKMMDFFKVEKSTFTDNVKTRDVNDNYYKLTYALGESLKIYDSENGKIDEKEIKSILDDFSSMVYDLIVERNSIQKAGKSISSKNLKPIKEAYELLGELIGKVENEKEDLFNMDEQKIQEMITKAVADAVEKAKTPTVPTMTEEETFEEKVAKAVAKALEPVQEQVTKMAEARGFTRTQEQTQPQQPETASIHKSYIEYK